jgi:hypothetical protein
LSQLLRINLGNMFATFCKLRHELLSLFFFGALATVAQASSGESLKFSVTKIELQQIEQGIEFHKLQRGSLPSTALDLSLPDLPDSLRGSTGQGFAGLRDPWANRYMYRVGSMWPNGFVVYSVGVNGKDELGQGDDIVNHSKHYPCDIMPTYCPSRWAGLEPYLSLSIAILLLGGLLFAALVPSRRKKQKRGVAEKS